MFSVASTAAAGAAGKLILGGLEGSYRSNINIFISGEATLHAWHCPYTALVLFSSKLSPSKMLAHHLAWLAVVQHMYANPQAPAGRVRRATPLHRPQRCMHGGLWLPAGSALVNTVC
jgi:hypothetical protein